MSTPSQSHRARVRRILKAWDACSAHELADGLAWYERAHGAAAAIALETGLTERQCAGILAALSPRCGWSENIRRAAVVAQAAADGARSCPAVSTRAFERTAWRIARGEDPAEVLSGPKVRAFFANITGDVDAVTVDVHAQRLAIGTEPKSAPTGREYARIADAFRAAARARGVAPRDMQAATWVHVRGSAS